MTRLLAWLAELPRDFMLPRWVHLVVTVIDVIGAYRTGWVLPAKEFTVLAVWAWGLAACSHLVMAFWPRSRGAP